MNYKKIGQYIKRKREERGYTQFTLANELFISRESVSKWERGISIPDVSIILKLSELLEVSVTEILSGEDSKSRLIDLIEVNYRN